MSKLWEREEVPVPPTWDRPAVPRKIGPLTEAQPVPCAACQQPLAVGQYVVLVPLGPAEREEGRVKCAEGRVYTGVAAAVHWECADLRRLVWAERGPDLFKALSNAHKEVHGGEGCRTCDLLDIVFDEIAEVTGLEDPDL